FNISVLGDQFFEAASEKVHLPDNSYISIGCIYRTPESGKQATESSGIAEIFNKYFIETVEELCGSSRSAQNFCVSETFFSNRDSVFLEDNDVSEVFGIINSMKNKKSGGSDGIPCFIVKHDAKHLIGPLKYLI
ncbi:hypothetical protein HHI36_011061, partial [Cryptolaemus montrouzieri]